MEAAPTTRLEKTRGTISIFRSLRNALPTGSTYCTLSPSMAPATIPSTNPIPICQMRGIFFSDKTTASFSRFCDAIRDKKPFDSAVPADHPLAHDCPVKDAPF